MMERGFDDVRRILDRQLGVTGWEISTPRDGWSGTSFIAERAGTRVFVKLDVNPPVLLRLSELGIAPPILKSGLTGERAYVIQEYIAGTYPPRGWFATQLSALATLIRRYQQDDWIKALIGTNQMISREDIARRTESLVQRLKHASPAFEKSPGWKESISNFFAQVDTLDEISLVFTHGDPSRKNFLLRGDHVYLVDWDEAAPSDPLRDIGPLLWWYVPQTQWRWFFTDYGMPMTESVLDRLYWWVAEESLDIALALEERGYRQDVQEFLEDFAAAIRHEGNPRTL